MDPALVEAFFLLCIGIVAALIIHVVFKYLKKRAGLTETQIDDILVHSLGKPLMMLAFFIPLYFAINIAASVYPDLQWVADSRLLTSVYIIIGTWIVSVFVDDLLRVYGLILAKKTETEFDDRIIGILQKIGKYIIWFAGLLYVLSYLDVNITPLIAGAGIVGIAIALAAQDVFSNVFGSAVIITDQPFRVGDRVKIDNITGDVVHIGPRSTRLLSLDSDVVTIPNNKISSSIVHNYSLPDPRVRIQIPVSVSYDADPEKVTRVLGEICDDAVKNRSDVIIADPKPTVLLTALEASSLTFLVTVYATGFRNQNIIKDYIHKQILDRFRKESITIPYNILDVRIEKP
jgi:MscS family membrane protein